MKLLLIISLLSIFVSSTSFYFYMMRRINKVSELRNRILNLCYEYNVYHIKNHISYRDAYDWCYDVMPNYDKMLYSFKSLKLNSFLSDLEINELTYFKEENKKSTV